MFAIGCKQTNNNEGQRLDNPKPSNEITIKVKGDEGVKIKEPFSFKVKKSSTWKDIKQKAIDRITTKENKEIKEWRVKDEKGKVLQEGTTFEKDETVFAITKDKETPTPPANSIIITIEADDGYTFKEATLPCRIEVNKGATWSNTKEKAKAKIELKKGYEKAIWKLGGKDGTSLEDAYVFNENTTIYATSKKKDEPEIQKITITVRGDEGIEVASLNTFNVDKGSKWADIKTQAIEKVKVKENFEIKEWRIEDEKGAVLQDGTTFEKDETVWAVKKENIDDPEQPKPDYTTPNGTSVEIIKTQNGGTQNTTLKGDIYIDDLISDSFKEKLKDITNINTANLNINCFKPKTISGQSIQTKNIPNIFETREITPEILKEVLELKKSKNFSTLKLNNKSSKGDIVEILFTIKDSKKNKYFDISDLAIFSFNDEFKLDNNSDIFLKADRTKKLDGNYNITPYAKITELLKLLENKALQDYITVGDVYVSGKVDKLLPYLAGSEKKQIKKIKEKDGGIKFLNSQQFTCESVTTTGINFTEYEGEDGEKLSAEEFLEFNRRTNTHTNSKKIKGKPLYVNNLVIKYLDTKKISTEELETLTLLTTKVVNSITFEGGDLSKMRIQSLLANGATLKFEGTTLPYNMNGSKIKNLILNNVTFPKQEIMEYIKKHQNVGLRKLNSLVPHGTNLEIYGYVKDSPLEDLTTEQLENLYPKYNMPSSYKGPQDIYDRLKTYIYKGESIKKEFGNFTSSLNKKPQSPVLLALLQGKADHTRG